VYDKSAMN